jgi:hypothetical protein
MLSREYKRFLMGMIGRGALSLTRHGPLLFVVGSKVGVSRERGKASE